MKAFFRFIIIILCIFNISCKQEKSEKINTNVITIDLKDKNKKEYLFYDFDYIKLETTEECLISSINKIINCNDTIIIHSIKSNNIFEFSNTGTFIKKYSIGNGPNDIIYPVDIAYNKDNNTLWILDNYRILKEFNRDGKLKSQTQVKDPYMRIATLDSNLFLFDANIGKANDFLFNFINKNKSHKHIKKNEVFREIAYLPNSTFNIINDSIIYFHHQFEDLIYCYHTIDEKVDTLYNIEYKSYQSISSIKEKVSISPLDYQKKYDNKDYIFGLRNLYCNEDKLFFTSEKDKINYCVFKNDNKELIMSENLIKGLPNPRNIYGFDGRYIYYIVNVEDLKIHVNELNLLLKQEQIPSKIKDLISNIKEDDNPIIIKIDMYSM